MLEVWRFALREFDSAVQEEEELEEGKGQCELALASGFAVGAARVRLGFAARGRVGGEEGDEKVIQSYT